MIINPTGGGGAALNFKVEAYASETDLPATAAENTIAVFTGTEINGWVFSPVAPAAPVEGLLWVYLGSTTAVPFNALKKNNITLFPVSVSQYVNGLWAARTAKTYQSGVWVDWVTHLFNEGEVNEALTGGINGVIDSGAISFSYSSMPKGQNQTYTTGAVVDLTDYNTMHVRYMGVTSLDSVYLRIFATATEYDGDNIGSGTHAASTQSLSPFNREERELVLDVSDLAGGYYLGYAWGVVSSSSGSRTVNGSIYEWWLA